MNTKPYANKASECTGCIFIFSWLQWWLGMRFKPTRVYKNISKPPHDMAGGLSLLPSTERPADIIDDGGKIIL